jgi:organic hydroperoxide reductase OsmC/OhrA
MTWPEEATSLASLNQLSSAGARALFVVPARTGASFQASIRGRMLDLADPGSADWLAPTPDDLFVAAIASDFAWLARRFLVSRGLDDYVSVSAAWRTHNGQPRLAQFDMTVTVSKSAETTCSPLVAVLRNRFAARSLSIPLRVRVQSS